MDSKRRRVDTQEPSMKRASNEPTSIDLISSFIDTNQDRKEIAGFIETLLDERISLDSIIHDICDYINSVSGNNPLSVIGNQIITVGHGMELELYKSDIAFAPTSIFMSPRNGITYKQAMPEAATLSQSFYNEKNVTEASRRARESHLQLSKYEIERVEALMESMDKYIATANGFRTMYNTFKTVDDTEKKYFLKNFNLFVEGFNTTFKMYKLEVIPGIPDSGPIPQDLLITAKVAIISTLMYLDQCKTQLRQRYDTSQMSLANSAQSVQSCSICKNDEGDNCCPSLLLSGRRGYDNYDRPLCYCIPKIKSNVDSIIKLKIDTMFYFLLKMDTMFYFLLKMDLNTNNNILLDQKHYTYDSIVQIFYGILKKHTKKAEDIIIQKMFDILVPGSIIGSLVRNLFHIDLPIIDFEPSAEIVTVNLKPILEKAQVVNYLACLSGVCGTEKLPLVQPSTPQKKGGSKKLSICPYCRNHLRIIQWDLTTPDKIMKRNISWSQFFGKLRENKSIKKKHYKSARKSKRRYA
jgi:hypothetical protein